MPTIDDWIKLYASANPEVHIRAAAAILDRADDANLDLLIDILLSLHTFGLGAKAEKALSKRRDKELVPKMIALLDSSDVFVREVACNVLGTSGDHRATPHLLRMIDDPAMWVRRTAGFGLASLKDPSALPTLKNQLRRHQDDDPNVIFALRCAIREAAGGSA